MSADHESPIKTPRQLIIAILLAFIVPIIVIALLVKYVNLEKRTGAGIDTTTKSSIESRIKPVAGVDSIAGYSLKDPNAPKVLRSGEVVYKAQCAACHDAGAAGAPKFGDAAGWSARLKTGFDSLWSSSLKGKGAMSAQGGGEYDDLEIANAVVYLANGAGGKFEAPKGAAAAPVAAPATVVATAAAPAAPAPAATPAPAAPAGELPAKVYFDSGKAGLTADAQKTIVAAVSAMKSNTTAAVDITGYTDKKGSAERNAELAKERAKAVRAALETAGIAKERINMKPPVSIVGDGDDKAARRVEINLAAK
jgi:outer membrane protein OmpA-like peptidoglycan-associated protein